MAEEAAAVAAWPGLVLLHHRQTFHSASAGQRKSQKTASLPGSKTR